MLICDLRMSNRETQQEMSHEVCEELNTEAEVQMMVIILDKNMYTLSLSRKKKQCPPKYI